MKQFTRILLYVCVCVVVVGAGYLGYEKEKDTTSTDSNIIPVHASWGDEAKDVKSLIKESDLVVVGKMTEQMASYQPFENYEDTFTDAKFTVGEIIKGDISSKEVVISQYGGERKDGKVEVFESLPLMEKDTSYLLFLTKIEDDTNRDGKYQTTGGPQGYYTLLNNSNFSTFALDDFEINGTVNGEINEKVENTSIAELRSMVTIQND
ncbi:hypothetical protein [Pontibacillus litoralis]|uniref:Uncharacterized protein n=1 Tax=Pontibacillus litoralis JSM 072002 TaxID=1385512 RepID=A0A0A5G1G4_9BACI|nr:hypothetical protein [Pontibacillus litoralis]KGX84910.1 hypothetical protein N784_11595 [Pontibacillus litoralis JSM 072002]